MTIIGDWNAWLYAVGLVDQFPQILKDNRFSWSMTAMLQIDHLALKMGWSQRGGSHSIKAV